VVLAVGGDQDTEAPSRREGGRGRVLHGKWVVGIASALLIKADGGHTPLSLAVRCAVVVFFVSSCLLSWLDAVCC
jgi:hypothetical protein